MVSVLATLATLGTLVACTPAAKRVTALRNVDGHPTLLLAACDTFEADGLLVSTVDPSPWKQWNVDRGAGEAVEEVRLLQLPPGWVTADETLTALQPDTEYTVIAFDSGKTSFPVRFVLTDLVALAPDQVLIGEAAGKRRAVTESDFRSLASKSC
ncbi:hypothetical protein KBX50_03730 [Micromonospora sp. C51]|uniref:hypothetical protein n=1 Tax=Micromonospora sp. C51 TaxID=2824879 RepID=UPI001B38D126|nr:hypothetical protein [Micromonospora sp. C51]MBQ1047600.1 hypothetical protein [Micromonospora sp. C51]